MFILAFIFFKHLKHQLFSSPSHHPLLPPCVTREDDWGRVNVYFFVETLYIEAVIAFDLFDPFFSSSLPLSVTSIFLSLAMKVNYPENSTQLQLPYLKLIFSAVS